jgi:O-antigen ligase
LNITPIGWILIPLGLASYWWAPERLYVLMIFSLPFSATAVVNIGGSDASSGVQASIFFGALWIMRELPKFRHSSGSPLRENLRAPTHQLKMFAAVVLLSLIMPLWINGRVYIEDPEFANPNSGPLQFTSKQITQTLYLFYGLLLSLLIAFRNSEVAEFVRSIRIFVISAIFVSAWGFFQFSCYLLGFTYPAYIFNTSATESAMGYLQELEDIGLKRISSVATEPSIFAACMLLALVFALFALVRKQPLISKMWDRFAVAIIVGALLISTSTIAYVGLAAVFVGYLLGLVRLKVLRPKYVVMLLSFAALLGLVYVWSSSAQDLMSSMIVGKSESYSGIGRLYSIVLAAGYFLQYPILGLGWGSVTSHDLVFKLLSNTGILGFLTFSLFLVSLLRRLWRTTRTVNSDNPEGAWRAVCSLIAFLILMFSNLTTDFVFVYGHLWFVLGLAMSATALSPAESRAEPPPLDLQGNEAIIT